MSIQGLLKYPPSDWTNLFAQNLEAVEYLRTIPVTTAKRDTLIGQDGMIVFNEDENEFQVWYSDQWHPFGVTGATGATGATGPSSVTIISKFGSGTGNYTLSVTSGETATSIDEPNLDHTIVVPTGYKLTITAMSTIINSQQSVSSYLLLYDGGTNGTGGTLLSCGTLNGSNGGVGQRQFSSLQAIVTGDDASHSIHYMGFTPSGTAGTILNSTNNNRLVIPQVIYRLEPSS